MTEKSVLSNSNNINKANRLVLGLEISILRFNQFKKKEREGERTKYLQAKRDAKQFPYALLILS